MTKPSYREILRSKFQEKTDRNRRYSLRAFAKDLGVSAPLLSQVLGGKRGLSETMARDVARKLKLSSIQQDYFCDLVAADHAKSDAKKAQAQERLKNYDRTKIKQLGLEYFVRIHEWHHFAILECIGLKDFQPSTSWLSKKLNVDEIKIRLAVERLIEIGLLKITDEGHWIDTHEHVHIRQGSDAVKNALLQYMQLATNALKNVPIENRANSAFFMRIDSSRLDEARRTLETFNQAFVDEYNSAAGEKDAVFMLSSQFFPVTT